MRSSKMRARRILVTCVWITASYALLTALVLQVTDLFGASAVSLYGWELARIAPDYEIESVRMVKPPPLGQRTIEITARNKTELIDAHIRLWPPGSVQCSGGALVAPALKAVIIVLMVPLAWPALRWNRRLAALAVAMPCVVVAEALDVPLIVLGNLDRCFNHASFTTTFGDMLSSGGDWALSIAMGIVACVLGQRLFFRPTLQQRSGPARSSVTPPVPAMDAWKERGADAAKQAGGEEANDRIILQPEWTPVTSYSLRVEPPSSTRMESDI